MVDMASFQIVDRTGERYGKLTVIKLADEKEKSGAYKWVCRCDCGNIVIVGGGNLRNIGGTRSCGHCVSKAIPAQEYDDKKRIELSAITKDWEYVRCYNRDKSKHVVRCVHCGAEKKVIGLLHISECTVCKREQRRIDEERRKYKACAVCGAVFEPSRSDAVYCSERCSEKAYKERHVDIVREKSRINKRLREARAKDNGKIDYSITLAKLIERDRHICQLCGREVNENDYVYVGDTFVAGNDYPSIDHIKPLSKGGLHQWDNVQLAHRLCNSIKQNKE